MASLIPLPEFRATRNDNSLIASAEEPFEQEVVEPDYFWIFLATACVLVLLGLYVSCRRSSSNPKCSTPDPQQQSKDLCQTRTTIWFNLLEKGGKEEESYVLQQLSITASLLASDRIDLQQCARDDPRAAIQVLVVPLGNRWTSQAHTFCNEFRYIGNLSSLFPNQQFDE